ncbi:IclR family transcriptional regulator [Aeromicrobium ginsengisoli]|nr:IclR family transcriptional regulator [Aeromicrobium ginsengisoli]
MTREPGMVEKVATVLRVLASSSQSADLKTAEIARRCGIPRATTHRLLTSLEHQGLAERDRRSGCWYLGPDVYLLGRAAAPRYDITSVGREAVHRLALETGESAFLSVRRGDETVCLIREDGSFPLRSFVLYEGARFPLGVVSAGLVTLAMMPDREVLDYLDRVDLASDWGQSHSRPELMARLHETRRKGYAVNPGLVVEGSWGMAAAVFDDNGQPAWALTLTGVATRFQPGRQKELGRLLLDAAHNLTVSLQSSGTTVKGPHL